MMAPCGRLSGGVAGSHRLVSVHVGEASFGATVGSPDVAPSIAVIDMA